MEHNVFNFDFIAFGKFNQTRKGDTQLRDPGKLDFFQNFVHSGFADSFSLYTLELFEWSERFNQQIAKYNHEKAWYGLKKYGTDDDVYEEFELLKSVLLDAGYQRYEISNYSKAGSNSIHNRIYRGMGERLWLGTGATSHLKKEKLEKMIDSNDVILKTKSKESLTNQPSPQDNAAVYSWHISIVPDLKRFFEGNWIDEKKTELLSEQDFLKEKFLMGMRTMDGVVIDEQAKKEIYQAYLLQSSQQKILPTVQAQDHGDITSILIPEREEKVELYEAEGLCEHDGVALKLTDAGMDVYNSIISELMK